jgi:hypothetical protein
MPRYRRRGSYSSRRRYRRSSRSSGGTVRRALGNLKSARQQKDNATVNINVMTKTSCSQQVKWIKDPGTEYGSQQAVLTPFNCGNGFINVYEVLRRSDFFNCYAPMYDQFKIDMIRAKLTPTAYPSSITVEGQAGSTSYTILTAWDRTGFSSDQWVEKLIDERGAYSAANLHWYFLGPTNGSISSYSSAITKNVNTGSSFSIVRYLYPSTQAEKGQYLSTKSLVPTVDKTVLAQPTNANPQTYYDYVDGSEHNPDNPCDPSESTAIPFKPVLLIGILGVNDLPSNQINGPNGNLTLGNNINPIYFNVEFDIAVTFRGLRRTQIV